MERLKEIMEERGLSRIKVAEKAGLNPATIYRIVNGERSPTVETLEKLAEALDVEVADFFPKLQAPLPFELVEEPQERGSLLPPGLLEDWQHLFEQAAEQWRREAESGGLFDSAAGAIAYSIATNTQAAQFFEIIGDRLMPTIENLLPEDLARTEHRKLLEVHNKLQEAVEAVNNATLVAAPELNEEREFTEAEIAMIDEAAKEFEELPELEQRRQLREAWGVVDRIIEEQAAEEARRQSTA